MTDTKEDSSLAIFFGGALLTISTIVVYSYTLAWMWRWFLSPLGLPYISMGHAYGILLFYNTLTMGQSMTLAREKNHWALVSFAKIAISLLLLVVGYIVHTFFM